VGTTATAAAAVPLPTAIGNENSIFEQL